VEVFRRSSLKRRIRVNADKREKPGLMAFGGGMRY
jgi:hypothetical protein